MENQNPDMQSPEKVDELRKTSQKDIARKLFLIFIWVYAGLLFYVGARWIMLDQKISQGSVLLIAAGLALLVLVHKRSLFRFKKGEETENQSPDVQSPEQVDELKKTGETAIADKLLLIFIWIGVGVCVVMLFFAGGLIIKFEQKVSLEPVLLIVAGLAMLVLMLVYGRKVERPPKE
jgi:fatty acid desaturase